MSEYTEIVNRAKSEGVGAMSTAELMAIVAGGQSKDTLKVCEEMSAEYGLHTKAARARTPGELLILSGGKLTQRQELSLLSAMELARRVYTERGDRVHISSPGDAAEYIMPRLRYETHEKFVVILLDSKNQVISTQQIAEGSLTSAVVHPREVLAPAIVAHAACFIAVHNHPSGNPYPSTEDRSFAKALAEAGEVMGITFLDNLIVGDNLHYSFREHGEI